MTVLEAPTGVATWMPGTYTGPLQEPMVSDGPRLLAFVHMFCKNKDGDPLVLDAWQAWLICALLERYPQDWAVEELRGRLRYRQAIVSLARQNGKSEIAMVLGFYGLLMHESDPYVVGLASNKEQADIIYKRVFNTIVKNTALTKRFRSTGTRGITRLDKSGFYTTKPAKADALQGIPVTLCLFDEVHICDDDMWSAMVLGTQAMADGIVVGITTAGDDDSTLLKDLYATGKAAAAQTGSERFGFFLWEAPAGSKVDDPDAILAANPAVACGRRNMEVLLDAVRTMPEDEARRYVLNQFIQGADTAWLPMHLWTQAGTAEDIPDGPVWFGIDRTASWEHASIIACVKDGEAFYLDVVRALDNPSVQRLLDVCLELNAVNPTAQFVMDGYTLQDLATQLFKRGIPTKVMKLPDVSNASAAAYALIARKQVKHTDHDLWRQQMPFAVKKNYGNVWRISRQNSAVAIDAVMAAVFALHMSNLEQDAVMQLF